MKKNSGNTPKFQCRRTVRITRAEDEKLQRQAAVAHISVAEYMRRLFFGGRPIIARTDDQTIRELRRLGGLLKHHFTLAGEAHQSEVWNEMNRTLKMIQEAIDRLGQGMILKKFKRTNLTTTKRSMIGGIIDYVLSEKDEDGRSKCVWSTAMNFIAATRKGQRAEMISLAEESVRSKMPCAHWMMSWSENEIPTEQQITEAAQMFLKGMGLEGHQALVAVHTNTQNVHAHILVNRVHPDTLKVIQPHNGFDVEAAHRIVAAIEKVRGWKPQKNARYRIDENNMIVRNEPRKRQPPTRVSGH